MYIVGIVEREKKIVHVYEHRENKKMRERREEREKIVCMCACMSVDINARLPSSSFHALKDIRTI